MIQKTLGQEKESGKYSPEQRGPGNESGKLHA